MGIVLLKAIYYLLYAYTFVILVSALVSWMFLPPTSPVLKVLRLVTEPVLSPCRQLLYRILPMSWRRFDFSPVLALLLVQIIMAVLQKIIYSLY